MTIYTQPDQNQWVNILQRPTMDYATLTQSVEEILQGVKANGDQALLDYTQRFDKVTLDRVQVSSEEMAMGIQQVPVALQQAIRTAKENIERFHQQQIRPVELVETMPGVRCWQKGVGIEKVGLYVPGGTAPLFSSVLMLGVPAQLAGCREIVLCTPPQADGSVHPAVLFAAQLVGIKQVFKIGGAQAVAAMAYGTESVPAVYKIFGPGNQYVTAAKQLVSQIGVAIDMPAGPSEVLVVADQTAKPAFVAADLLSQAEHGIDSQVVLVALEEGMVKATLEAIEEQLEALPRAAIARKALENSPAVIVKNLSVALDLVNFYAPEHLILAMDDPMPFAEGIINAGSVFLGHYTPESVGDYASGTNHTLPTNGFARAFSGVNVDAFTKKITFQQLSAAGLQQLGPTVEIMAAAEALEAHKQAVSIRLKTL